MNDSYKYFNISSFKKKKNHFSFLSSLYHPVTLVFHFVSFLQSLERFAIRNLEIQNSPPPRTKKKKRNEKTEDVTFPCHRSRDENGDVSQGTPTNKSIRRERCSTSSCGDCDISRISVIVMFPRSSCDFSPPPCPRDELMPVSMFPTLPTVHRLLCSAIPVITHL